MSEASGVTFDLYIGIDYSGAETAESRLKGLQVYTTSGGDPQRVVAVPEEGKTHWNWSRAGIAEYLIGLAQTDTRFHAVLACLLGGYRWTKPYCVKVVITPDRHFVGVQPDGQTDDFGPVAILRRNLRNLIETMGLSDRERRRVATLINSRIVVQGGRFDAFEVLDLTPPDPRLN